jgi:hypothetical protein
MARVESMRTRPRSWAIRRTGERRITRCPSFAATFFETCCAPPMKRLSW